MRQRVDLPVDHGPLRAALGQAKQGQKLRFPARIERIAQSPDLLALAHRLPVMTRLGADDRFGRADDALEGTFADRLAGQDLGQIGGADQPLTLLDHESLVEQAFAHRLAEKIGERSARLIAPAEPFQNLLERRLVDGLIDDRQDLENPALVGRERARGID